MIQNDEEITLLERLRNPDTRPSGPWWRRLPYWCWNGTKTAARGAIDRIPGGERGKRAVLWAVVLHMVALIIGLFVVALPGEAEVPEIIAEVVVAEPEVDLEMARQSAVKLFGEARPDASAAMASVMRAETAAVMAVPEAKTDGLAAVGLGMGEIGLGFGLGSGVGGGGLPMGKLPAILRGRCIPGERERLLYENGGSPRVEPAIIKTLDWLKKTQHPTGGFWGQEYPAAMTGFALLAYLGHCETTRSSRYGETVAKGLLYLIEMAKKNKGRMGNLSNQQWAYEHAIATYALGEALTMSKAEGASVPDLEKVHREAVKIILDGQNEDGGWVYGYTGLGAADLSVTGWQVQALKAAGPDQLGENGTGRAMEKARKLISSRQGERGGFGYRGVEDRHSLTGVGILGLQMLGDTGKGQIARGVDFYLSAGPFDYTTQSCDLYSWYYFTQATFNYGGKSWEDWNSVCRDQLLDHQQDDGSWLDEGSGRSEQARGDAPIYRTCLAVLMLEVYYRYLPATGQMK